MKFECDSCHAQYMIADEKVGKRGVKVKCKRCAHVIIVRPGGVQASAKPVETTEPARDQGAEQPFDDGLDATRAGEASQDLLAAAGRGAPPEVPDSDDADATAHAPRPAPISMAMDPEAAPAGGLDTTQVAVAPQMSGAERGTDDATELGGPPHHSGVFGEPTSPAAAAAPAAFAAAAPPEPAPPEPAPAPGIDAGALLDDQIAGAFNSMFDAPDPGLAGDDAPHDERGPTKVLDLDQMNVLRQQTTPADDHGLDGLRAALGETGPPEESGLSPWKRDGGGDGADDGPAQAEWHVAIDEADVGPISLGEMGRHIEAGRVDRDSLVWKIGMDDWIPASEVPTIRALFDAVPMPKIAAHQSQPPRGLGGLDVGAPIDDLPPSPMSGLAADDPFSAPEGNTDPSWRPHGLTDVYQAANLAELAASDPAIGGLKDGGASSSGSASAAFGAPDPEWRPSAASALSSLVNEEMNRIDAGPPPASDDDLSMPPAADDGSIATPFSSLARGDLDAGPDLSAMMGTGGRSKSMPGAPAFGADLAPPSYPPPPMAFAPANARPQWFWPAVAGGGFVVLLLLVMMGVLIAAVLKPAPAPIVAAPEAAPAEPTKVAMATAPAADAPATGAAADGQAAPPADAKDDAKDEAKDEAKDDAKADAKDEAKDDAKDEAKADDDDDKGAAQASRASERERERERERDRERARSRSRPEPKEPEKKPPAATKAGGGKCDPILDFDCKPSGGGGGASEVKESLSKNDVLVVIMKSKGSVEACGSKHGVKDVVKMRWEISKSGRTAEVQVADSKYAGTPVGTCLVGAIKRWKFPAYAGSPVPPVTFPFKLKG